MQRTQLLGKELEKLLVPNRPRAVKIIVAVEIGVGVKLVAAIVALEPRGAGKGLKSHRAVLCSVEKGGGVTLVLAQFAGQARHGIERGGCEKQRFDKVGQRRQNRRHALDALAPVGIGVPESHRAAGDEGVQEGREPLVGAAAQGLVVKTDVLLAVTFQNQHHHVAGRERGAVGGLVEWGIECGRLLVAHVVRDDKRRLFQGPED